MPLSFPNIDKMYTEHRERLLEDDTYRPCKSVTRDVEATVRRFSTYYHDTRKIILENSDILKICNATVINDTTNTNVRVMREFGFVRVLDSGEYELTPKFITYVNEVDNPGLFILNSMYAISGKDDIKMYLNLILCSLREGYKYGKIVNFPDSDEKFKSIISDSLMRQEYRERVYDIYGFSGRNKTPSDDVYTPNANYRVLTTLKNLNLISASTDENGLGTYVLTPNAIHLLQTIDSNIASSNVSKDDNDVATEGVSPKSIDKSGVNIILYGVPGCGKSHTIKTEYCNDKNLMERVVFHPDYTYSDFIGQILPVIDKVNGEEKISYKFTPGPFTKILKDAVDDAEGKMHYLVIEEINRGNAPAIFGEVFQLLDRENGESEYGITNFDIADYVYGDKEHEIKIPANLTILATMNTADQNVFTLDTAFKRRWVMRSIKNDITACEHADECIAGTNVTWYSFAKKINDTIIDISDGNLSSEDNRLGAYFVKSEDLKSRKVFGEKVLMYLWNDAFKYDRDTVFNSEYKTLEDLLDAFEDYGFVVFNSALEFDAVVTETAEGSSKYEGDPQEYLSTKKPEFVAIYETLVELLESKISTTIDKYTTRTNDHISLRTQGKVLAEVHIQKAKIKVLTRVPNNTEYLIGTKVPDTHNWTLNYSIDFSDDSNIETVVNAIIDSQNLA